MNIIQKIFGTHSQNELKRVYPIADAVMALDEPKGAVLLYKHL